jgi:hypothetical protein
MSSVSFLNSADNRLSTHIPSEMQDKQVDES